MRSNIDASIKRISMRKGAVIVAIELKAEENKYVFALFIEWAHLVKRTMEV